MNRCLIIALILMGMHSGYIYGHQHPKPNVLLVNVQIKDLDYSERERLSHYNVIERAAKDAEAIADLASEARAVKVMVRKSSGVYEYNVDGTLGGPISMVDPSQAQAYEEALAYMSESKPMPGYNVPEYLYPGDTRYSYLFGEGANLPRREYSWSRRAVKELAGVHQNDNVFPLWRQDNLTANRSTNNFLDIDNLDSLGLTSNAVSDFVSVATQWGSYTVGVSSTVLDAAIDYRDEVQKRTQGRHYRQGAPTYYYPDQAYDYGEPLAYQPTYPW